jgi:hypothetical protein
MNKNLCLHCGAKLLEAAEELSWNYNCPQCGRGWGIDENGNWYAYFASRVYTAEEVEKIQKMWGSKK